MSVTVSDIGAENVPESWLDAVNAAVEAHIDDCGVSLTNEAIEVIIRAVAPLIRDRVMVELRAPDKATVVRQLRAAGFRQQERPYDPEPGFKVAVNKSFITDGVHVLHLGQLDDQEATAAVLDRYAETLDGLGYAVTREMFVDRLPVVAVRRRKAAGALRLGEMQAEMGLARSLRLASPSAAVDAAVHTPERVRAYLTARGWKPRPKERGLWDLEGRETVLVHGVASAPDYAKRTGLLASDLASIYGTGELNVLADIAAAETEAVDA